MSIEESMVEAQKLINHVIQQFNKETVTFRNFYSSFMLLRCRLSTADDLYSKVQVFFEGHDELIKAIHNFFPKDHTCVDDVAGDSETPPSSPPSTSTTPSPSPSPSPSEPLPESNGDGCGTRKIKKIKKYRNREKKECADFVDRVSKSFEDDENFKEFLNTIIEYQIHKNFDILDEKFRVMFKDNPELYILFTRFGVSREDELNLLRKRNEIDEETFKSRIIDNKYERELFKFEEDMYLADRTFELLKSTKTAVERYVNYKRRIETGGTDTEPAEYIEGELGERILKFNGTGRTDTEEEFIRALEKTQIEELYGKAMGQVMLDQLLNEQPIIAGERILRRLESKLEECKIWHDEQKTICKEGFETNYANAMNYKPAPREKKRKRECCNNNIL